MNGAAKPHPLGMVAGLFLAAGLVLSASMATAAWLKVRTAQFITVKGSARKNVRVDLTVWKGSFATQAGCDSGQTSWAGRNDTSSLDKTITAVVTATFALK